MKTFDLFGITVAATAGLCGAALTFSPAASAGGGAACMATSSGPAAGGVACVDQMAGLAAPAPVVVPGPPPGVVPPVPLAPPPVPLVPPVGGAPILGAPAAAPVAPLITQGGIGGKGVPTNPALTADPVVLPGPAATPGPAPHSTLVTATGPAGTTP